MLKDKQLEAIDYLIAGNMTKAEIAKLCGISPRGLYRWIDNEEFKAEWQRRTQEYQSNLKKEVQNCMLNKVSMAMQNIWDLANNSSSEKIKLDANMFIYESQMGKATTKVEQTIDNKKADDNKSDDMSNLLNELEHTNDNDNDKENVYIN